MDEKRLNACACKPQADAQELIRDLLKQNPEVVVARRVMEQTRLSREPGIVVDNSNYYRLR